jgi:hypothetical protein
MCAMGHPDPQGYYRILNVHPKASAAAVRKAYRRRARELDPDANRRLGTKELSAALDEAYRVLSDPRARARYDIGDLGRAAPGAPASDAPDAPVPCSRCGQVSAQPRYVIFHQVIGRLTHTVHDRVQGVYCPRCARDVGIAASLMTWFVGWWGLPMAPVAAVRAIWRNMRGGEVPADVNARLLLHQARAFLARDKAPLARALAARAVALDPDGSDAAEARAIAERDGGPVPVLRDPWRGLAWAAPVHLAPALMVAVLAVLVAPGLFLPHRDAPAPVVMGGWHVTTEGATLRAGPGQGFPAMTTLSRFEAVSVRAVPTEDGWVPVRAGVLDGFLPSAEVAPGAGAPPSAPQAPRAD